MKFVSLFSGIGGFDLGFERAGLECVAQCEFDENCRELLGKKFSALVLDDVLKIASAWRRCRRGRKGIDNEKWQRIFTVLRSAAVWCGGFPCQDLSVAGARAGLAGERSGLWFAFRRLLALFRPAWAVIENVPGLLSSNGGRDFGEIVRGVEKLGYRWAYRTLDAQYFNVPQRRERVFIVLSLGTFGCAEVLFERDSVCGNPPPSREAGQGAPAKACGSSDGGIDREDKHTLIPEAYGGNDTRGPIDVATACRAKGGSGHMDFESETFIADPISTREGKTFDHSGKNAGQTHNLIVGTLQNSGKAAGSATQQDAESGLLVPVAFDTTQITNPDNRCQPRPGDPCHPIAAQGHPPAIAFAERGRAEGKKLEIMPGGITPALTNPGDGGRSDAIRVLAFSGKDHGQDATEDCSPTLRRWGHDESHANGGAGPAIAFQTRIARNGRGQPEDICPTLNGSDAGATSDMRPLTAGSFGVRRLTPTEYERLQGFPDGWTAGFSDSVRYRMLGNAVEVDCAEWIGRRLLSVAKLEARDVLPAPAGLAGG